MVSLPGCSQVQTVIVLVRGITLPSLQTPSRSAPATFSGPFLAFSGDLAAQSKPEVQSVEGNYRGAGVTVGRTGAKLNQS